MGSRQRLCVVMRGRCPPPEGGDRLTPDYRPGWRLPWEAVPSMWGPPGRAFAWSRGEGGDTSNPRLSRGGKPLSPGDTWSCLSYWGHVCLSYVVSVMFVLYCLSGLIGPPRPKVGQVRTVAPGGGAAGGRWAGADIQRPTCKNMHAFACARACARAHLSNERDRRVARARARASTRECLSLIHI